MPLRLPAMNVATAPLAAMSRSNVVLNGRRVPTLVSAYFSVYGAAARLLAADVDSKQAATKTILNIFVIALVTQDLDNRS